MSIIHDALKKVQTKSPGSAQPAPRAQEMPVIGQANAKKPFPALLTAGLIIATIAGLSYFFKIPFDLTQPQQVTQPVATPATSPTPSPAVPAPAATVAAAPQPAPAETTPRVEGIMDMGGKRVALINGNVYEEGQTVNGRVITTINATDVTLTENGTTRVLPLNP